MQLVTNIGPGYLVKCNWAVKMLDTDLNQLVLTLIENIKVTDKTSTYVQPVASERVLSQNGPQAAVFAAYLSSYSGIVTKIREFSVLSTSSAGIGTAMSTITTTPTIIIKSAGDEEKDIIARQGEVRCVLYHAGATINFDTTKVTDIKYHILLTTTESIYGMLCVSRGNQLSSALVHCHRCAKKGDNTHIFSRLFSIIVMPKATAQNLIV